MIRATAPVSSAPYHTSTTPTSSGTSNLHDTCKNIFSARGRGSPAPHDPSRPKSSWTRTHDFPPRRHCSPGLFKKTRFGRSRATAQRFLLFYHKLVSCSTVGSGMGSSCRSPGATPLGYFSWTRTAIKSRRRPSRRLLRSAI
jgi:hypothetical protein